MRYIYLVNYSVKGVKTLDNLVSLSFYKKTITKSPETQDYNIKGIYGMNGSGKSGIVTSVAILKNILTDSGYLNNPITQKNLDAIINKKTGVLYIEADYIAKLKKQTYLFKYCIELSKDESGKYIISHECLSTKKATSKSNSMEILFESLNGEFITVYGMEEKAELAVELFNKTLNLLSTVSVGALFSDKFLIKNIIEKYRKEKSVLFLCIGLLYSFGTKLQVYMDQSDYHSDYFSQNSLESNQNYIKYSIRRNTLAGVFMGMENLYLDVISITNNIVPKKKYEYFEKSIEKLCDFIKIFKSDLKEIEIEKKENGDFYICELIMVYEAYKINAEFESTGIKKLIKLFAYLKEMVNGGIVFIDEFDSNLHDVYLCALLEYLMEYGDGQLCFTTHNVGPMDILKQNKKSIDFLSEDHKIYPWKTNGNYSPSKLYRNGMIEGSPFNVDSIDFIGIFSTDEED